MRAAVAIAPRVVVYPVGDAPLQVYGAHDPAPAEGAHVGEGWTALAVMPGWVPGAAAAGRSGCAPVRVFGDGSHPTTRLCAAAVDLLCRRQPGVSVLDVGTGTGILARIAFARGAGFVVGTDIDPVAVSCAKAHAALDDVGGLGTATSGFGTSASRIYFGNEPPDHWGARFDLVVANILEAPLHSLAPALCRALLPGGVLLISGFTRPQAPALRLAYETAGLQAIGEFCLDEWALLKFSAPHKSTSSKSLHGIAPHHNFSR